ncbi:MAG: hypothetical protein MI742_18515 [Desulfobacterales bacterium]|nr:hypothetical protein [Desulfobacterales bacterium]
MQQHDPNTMDLCSSLFWNLTHKGLVPSEVNRLVKDLFCILQDGGTFTVGFINRRLNDMGWTGHIMDENTIELVLTILKNEFQYTVSTHTVH